MNSLIAAAGFITAAAVTPGPNNLLVMRAAAGGTAKALPAIAAIVLGSLVLLALVVAGGGTLFERYPVVRTVVTVAGALCLGWLGLQLALRASATANARDGALLPVGAASVFAFQFANPKGWVMVLTAAAAVQGDMSAVAAFAWLALLFVAILTASLALWSYCGALLATYLARPVCRVWLDRTMGGLLAVCALLLFL
jgi:threonine/homoserine/homoserine lactone efflux protein